MKFTKKVFFLFFTLLFSFSTYAQEVIDEDEGPNSTAEKFTSITVLNNRLAVSYRKRNSDGNGDLMLWHDDGRGGGTAGDETVNGGEIRALASTGADEGSEGSITVVGGRLAVSYWETTTDALAMWHDDGSGGGTAGDALANGNEIRMIETGQLMGRFSSMTSFNNRIAVSYQDGGNQQLKLWYDDGRGGGTSGDGMVNGNEIRIIDTGGVGAYTSITSLGGRLAISYYDQPNERTKFWLDDGNGGGSAGDTVASPGEIRSFDNQAEPDRGQTSITVFNNQLVIAYHNEEDAGVRLLVWYDDGRGGGTAGDGIPNGAEVSLIDSEGVFLGLGKSATVIDNRLAISYMANEPGQVNSTLRLWRDDGDGGGTAGDGRVNGSEIRTLDEEDSGIYSSIIEYQFSPAVSYVASRDTGDRFIFPLKLYLEDGQAEADSSGAQNSSEILNRNGLERSSSGTGSCWIATGTSYAGGFWNWIISAIFTIFIFSKHNRK